MSALCLYVGGLIVHRGVVKIFGSLPSLSATPLTKTLKPPLKTWPYYNETNYLKIDWSESLILSHVLVGINTRRPKII